MEDFIVGARDFSEQHTAQLRKRLGGVLHAYRTERVAPRPGDVVTVWLWVGDEQRIDHACCYYATNGSDSQGQRGQARQGQAVPMWPSNVE